MEKKISEDFELLCKSYIGQQTKNGNNKNSMENNHKLKKNQVVVTKSDKGNSIVLDDSTYTKEYQYFNNQNLLKYLNDNEQKYKLLTNFILDFKHFGSRDETFYKLVTPETFRTKIAYFLAKTQN